MTDLGHTIGDARKRISSEPQPRSKFEVPGDAAVEAAAEAIAALWENPWYPTDKARARVALTAALPIIREELAQSLLDEVSGDPEFKDYETGMEHAARIVRGDNNR